MRRGGLLWCRRRRRPHGAVTQHRTRFPVSLTPPELVAPLHRKKKQYKIVKIVRGGARGWTISRRNFSGACTVKLQPGTAGGSGPRARRRRNPGPALDETGARARARIATTRRPHEELMARARHGAPRALRHTPSGSSGGVLLVLCVEYAQSWPVQWSEWKASLTTKFQAQSPRLSALRSTQ